jgi:predicted nucleic acid-binding protein
MKISLDTSIIIEIERKKEETIELVENLLKKHEIFISAVVLSEIFTGTYLRKDYKKAIQKARRLFANLWKTKKTYSAMIRSNLIRFIPISKRKRN